MRRAQGKEAESSGIAGVRRCGMDNDICNIEMERPVNQTLWGAIMWDYGTDSTIENETFVCKMYDWSDKDDNDWHFWHKPSGLKIQWYKYPLRSPYSNMEITHGQFWDVLHDCRNSIYPKVTTQITKWWEVTR